MPCTSVLRYLAGDSFALGQGKFSVDNDDHTHTTARIAGSLHPQHSRKRRRTLTGGDSVPGRCGGRGEGLYRPSEGFCGGGGGDEGERVVVPERKKRQKMAATLSCCSRIPRRFRSSAAKTGGLFVAKPICFGKTIDRALSVV